MNAKFSCVAISKVRLDSTWNDTVLLIPDHFNFNHHDAACAVRQAEPESETERSEKKMIGDVEKMVAVGVVWGATNAIMRRGALLWDEALKSSPKPHPRSTLSQRILLSLRNWLTLLSIWQYSIPFALNLSASATFFALLSHSPLSLAVPVTNATTFAATALFAILLGERTHLPRAFLGTALIVLGLYLCINA